MADPESDGAIILVKSIQANLAGNIERYYDYWNRGI